MTTLLAVLLAVQVYAPVFSRLTSLRTRTDVSNESCMTAAFMGRGPPSNVHENSAGSVTEQEKRRDCPITKLGSRASREWEIFYHSLLHILLY